jgi:probable HAF family extracellular repeat protein
MKASGGAKCKARPDRVSSAGLRLHRQWALTSLVLCGCLAAVTAPGASASRKEPPPPPPPTATYTVTDLGNLGFQNTVARAINDNGQVTGYSGTPKTVEGGCSLRFRPCPTHVTNAFLWEVGTMHDLGTLGGNYSEGTGLNNLGEVVGKAQLKSGFSEAFLFRNGKITGIGSFSPAAINDLGVIAGSEGIPGEGHTDAVIWQNGKITDLGLLPGEGGIYTAAAGINKSDEVTGSGDNRESMMRAWVWRNGTMTDIETLGGPQAAAYAVNNAGQIVGFAQTSTDADHGFIYQSGKMTDLGLNIFPYAINNNGVIVGSGGCGGAIIVTGGVCRNLQNLIPSGSGYTLQEAKGINDNGQIIAYAQLESDPGHPVHAVLLTPN